jgi:hypothetical protein
VHVFVGLPGWECFGQCVFNADINWTLLHSNRLWFRWACRASGCCCALWAPILLVFPAIGAISGCAALEESKHLGLSAANPACHYAWLQVLVDASQGCRLLTGRNRLLARRRQMRSNFNPRIRSFRVLQRSVNSFANSSNQNFGSLSQERDSHNLRKVSSERAVFL